MYGYFLAVLSEPEMILVVVHCVVFYMFNISCSYFGIFSTYYRLLPSAICEIDGIYCHGEGGYAISF
jgi:hypothetical protein